MDRWMVGSRQVNEQVTEHNDISALLSNQSIANNIIIIIIIITNNI